MTAAMPFPKRRIALWGWPLVVLRLLSMAALLALCVPLHYLSVPFSTRRPIPRRFLQGVGFIAGLRVRTRGARPARHTFFLANHVTWLDILGLAGSTGTAFVAHDGLAQIGPLRWLCRLNDTVFVARHDRRSVAAQVAQVRTALADTGALTIFPEGTTSDGTGTLAFKSSLLSAMEGDFDIPVQPVWLDYGPETRRVAWVGEEPGLDNALAILARVRPVDLTIHFLPPLSPEDRADRKRMATAARTAIEAARAA